MQSSNCNHEFNLINLINYPICLKLFKEFMVSGHLKVTSIDLPSEKQTSSMKTKENISLSISNVNEIKRPTARLMASLKSIQTENSEASIFDVSKCSMDSSITTFLNQLTCCHAILGQTVATISK